MNYFNLLATKPATESHVTYQHMIHNYVRIIFDIRMYSQGNVPIYHINRDI